MIINPTQTIQTGNFSVFPSNTTHHEALRYTENPDIDGIIRPEPTNAVLILGYPAIGIRSTITMHLRGQKLIGIPAALSLHIQLLNGQTPLASATLTLSETLQTYTHTFEFAETNLSQPRLAVRTTDFNIADAYDLPETVYLKITMLVLDDSDNPTEPPYRKIELIPINDLRAPYWLMVVETNTDDVIDIPNGFKLVSLHPPLRLINNKVLPPTADGRTYTYFLTLREG